MQKERETNFQAIKRYLKEALDYWKQKLIGFKKWLTRKQPARISKLDQLIYLLTVLLYFFLGYHMASTTIWSDIQTITIIVLRMILGG